MRPFPRSARPDGMMGLVIERLLLGPGPSPVHPRVMEAMGRPTLGHLDPDFLHIMDETNDALRRVFRTKNQLTFPVSGTGSAAMETSMTNLLEEGDTAIIGVCGFFGARMAEMARRTGAEVVVPDTDWGTAVDPQAIEDALREHPDAKLVGMVHTETSTGILQPLEDVIAMCGERDTLFVLDTVASLGGIPVEVDAWGVDVCFSGSQKCLSVPPGLGPITFSPRALEVVERRTTPVRTWYLDVTGIRNYVRGERLYHHTAPVNLIYALLEGCMIVLEEGLEKRWARHEEVGRSFQERITGMGFELFAPVEFRPPQITSMYLPEGLDDVGLRKRLREEFGIEIAGGLGDFAGKVWRVGLLGEGARMENVDRLLEAIEQLLR